MSPDTKKVYTVKIAFEHDDLAYAVGEKYELEPALVATLPEGSVEEFLPDPQSFVQPKPEVKPEVKPAEPWVGQHTMQDK